MPEPIPEGPFAAPPTATPWFLRPMLWWARRETGVDALPAQLLSHAPRAAIGAGVFELLATHPPDLPARVLAVARIVSSTTAGCPFCVDMNSSFAAGSGLEATELQLLTASGPELWAQLGEAEAVAAELARALSLTPVSLSGELISRFQRAFTERQRVLLVHTIAQVNYWARFNQGLGVPAAGFCARAE